MKKFVIGLLVLIVLAGCSSYREMTGVVTSVEYVKTSSYVSLSGVIRGKTIVTFEDGRIKAFAGLTDKILRIGETNIIKYDNDDEILSVTIVLLPEKLHE